MKNLNIWTILICLSVLINCSKNSDDTGEGPIVQVDKTANLLRTGESANDILSNDNFDKLKIEIAFVAGFRPTQSAMDAFMDYLRTYTFKEDIEMVFKGLDSANKETLTLQEVIDLEEENRTVYNDGKTLGIYIYFTDAAASSDNAQEGRVTIGSVYRNTSMIIYESTIRRIANQSDSTTNADVETATINHEFGHLFGLVDLGTPKINDHEDVDSANHCNVSGCLMRTALQFGSSGKSANLSANNNEIKASCSLSAESVLKMLETNTSKGFSNSVPLDAECILDLQSNGGR
ncbi:hypothetical protein [Maribacter sp. 2308TA10-17]|uniref:hypothetical protein n=1 Tax=Maribacter sp. 2308TA10-17 TaxID=3386276 RepID=UPI0039BD05AE